MKQNMKWWQKKVNRNTSGKNGRGKTVKLLSAAALALSLAFGASTVPVEAASSTHVAKQGDTFYLLSKKYGVNLNKLMQANPKIKATNIYPGLKIKIPTTSTVKSTSTAVMLPSLSVDSSNKVVEAWGKTFNYSKTISVKASAYSAAASENGGWGAVDYFGNPLELGTIAVDPKVIPLGTKVLVTGHSHPGLPKKAFVAVAKDIGGAIKGNRIDIFIPGSQKSVSEFGFQNVKLYVIK